MKILRPPYLVVLLMLFAAGYTAKGQASNELNKSLLQAADDANAEQVQTLLSKGADVNAKDKEGYTALYYAIWNKNKDMVKLLVDKGADVNVLPTDDGTPLEYVVWDEDVEMARLFVAKGARFDVKDHDGWTAFRYAVSQGNQEILELFVSKGADVSTLHVAAGLGDLARVKDSLTWGTDVDVKDEMGWTPLYWAASMGQEEVGEFLVSRGARIDVKTDDDSTPLHQAARSGAARLVELFISKGANIKAADQSGSTPLHAAAAAGHAAIVQILLARGANPNAKDRRGRIPLDLAKSEGHSEIAALLVPSSSKVNEQDDTGWAILHHAASNGWDDIVQVVLDRQADVNARDKERMTPLHLAAENGHEKIVEILLGRGAYVDANDTYGRTGLHCAAVRKHENVVGLLLEKDANIAARDNAGRTPLHYAAGAGGLYKIRDWAQAGDPNIVRLLLAKGANINAADKEGRTPLHYATFNSIVRRDMAMVQLLVEKGADLDIVDRRGRTPRAIVEWILYETRGSAEVQTQYGNILKEVAKFLDKNGGNYFVASEGDDLNPGTIEHPFKTIQCALRIVEAGDMILVRGGTYHCASTMHLDKSGQLGNPIRLRAYPNETPIFDFSKAKGSGFVVTGSHWHLKGLTIANAENTGIDLETPNAHHNILEQIYIRYCGDAGLVLRIGVAHNLVLNCDSYQNFDPWTNGENADGFGAWYSVGDGNVFVGCRAWNNSDDGFDFDRSGAGLRLENCYAWRNGMNVWNHPCFTGNGSGFKLWDAAHLLIYCAAWDHPWHGFNRGKATHTAFLKNCTALRDNINYSFRGAAGTEQDVLINNLSCSAGTYIHPDVNDHFNSWNTPAGVEITEEDFLSLDDSVVTGPRNPDGGIPESDFLRLAPDSDAIDAGTDVGLPFVGKAPDLGAFEYDPQKAKQQSGVKWLHQAVRDHDIQKIRTLLTEGADVNEKDWLGYAPLHWACYFGYADVAKLLLDSTANPSLISDTGRTPLDIAQAMDYEQTAELVRKHGAE